LGYDLPGLVVRDPPDPCRVYIVLIKKSVDKPLAIVYNNTRREAITTDTLPEGGAAYD
jgi:hypothetical protein